MDPEKQPPEPEALDAETVQNHMQSGASLVDLRPPDAFLRAHVPGSINMPAQNSQMVRHLMNFLHPGARVIFLDNDPVEAQEVAETIHQTRRNPVLGWYEGTIGHWQDAGASTEPFPIADIDELRDKVTRNEWIIIDVREPQEWQSTGIVPQSKLIPLNQVHTHITELATNEQFATICRTGPRAIMAASLLRSHGFNARAVAPGGVPNLPFSEREMPQ